MRAARERGLVVGRDIAIAGYDGTDDSEHMQPPLTTLKQPVYEIARRLVKLLVACIEGKELLEPQMVLQPELIVRASTGS
jgi:DNA-binding LacI/PurR family transcriptional regulator